MDFYHDWKGPDLNGKTECASLFISCLDQFCLYLPKSGVNGIARKHKWQKSETYMHNRTYKRLVRMAVSINY